MRFLKMLFWLAVAVFLAIFAGRNWHNVTVNLWGDLQADIKLPLLLAVMVLLGFLPPTAGEARILGRDSQKLTPEDRGRIGFVNEEHTLPGWVRVSQVVAM